MKLKKSKKYKENNIEKKIDNMKIHYEKNCYYMHLMMQKMF